MRALSMPLLVLTLSCRPDEDRCPCEPDTVPDDSAVSADCDPSSYPLGDNQFPGWSDLWPEFVDYDSGDLTLIESSQYRAGELYPPYDGDMRGADIACLDVLLAGVDRGVYGQ